MIDFCEIPEFQTDKSSLPYGTLESDLERLRKVLEVNPRGRQPQIFRIPLGRSIEVEVYKVKHFRCESLRGKGARSGIRVIYAYIPEDNKIVLIEIYYKKSNSTDCDKKRITRYFHKDKGLYFTT